MHFLFAELLSIRVFKQACRKLGSKHPAYCLINHVYIHLPLFNQFFQIGITFAGSLYVQSRTDGLHGALCRTAGCMMKVLQHLNRAPVGIDISFKAPLFPQNIGQQIAGSGVGDTVPGVVGGHHSHDRQPGNYHFKGFQIDIVQVSHPTFHGREVQPAQRIAMRAEMLQHRRNAIIQITACLRTGEYPAKERVFPIGFFHPSPTQIADYINAGSQYLTHPLRMKVTRCRGCLLISQRRIEGTSQRYILRIYSGTFVGGAMQGLRYGKYRNSQPGALYHILLNEPHILAAIFPCQRETFYKSPTDIPGKGGELLFVQRLSIEYIPGMYMADLGYFLFERHPAQQVFHSFANGQRGILIRIYLSPCNRKRE